jgi:hypothetical protein
MDSIEAALAACALSEAPNYAQIAREFKCNRSTLSRRHRGVTRAQEDLHESQQLLSHHQEIELVKYINRLSEKGIPPTCSMVRNFAAEIAQIQPGQRWPYRFVQRHQNELKSCYLQGLDLNRKKAESYTSIKSYFELVSCLNYVSD